VEALDFAIGAWRVGLDPQVTDHPSVEQLGQRAVLGVAEVVVAHQPLDDDAVPEKPVEGSLGEAGDRGGPLIVVDLRVGQPRAVVDDRVDELPADPP